MVKTKTVLRRSLGSKMPRKARCDWQAERIAFLVEICQWIDRERDQRGGVVKACTYAALNALGKRYSNGMLAKLSEQTIYRAYRKWVDSKGDPRALGLNCWCPNRGSQMPDEVRDLFVELVERGEITSMQQGYRLLVKTWPEAMGETLPASQSQLYRAFSSREKLRFLEIFEERKRSRKKGTHE